MYWHLAPTQRQVRKIVWDNIDAAGRRMTEQAFPEILRTSTHQQEMQIKLKGGSIWQCVGSDNYDSLVGANPVGVVFSEYSLADPAAWNYLRPILAENGGWAIFLYTPRGRNHGYRLWQMANTNEDWYCETLTADDTGAVSKEAIQAERKAGMSEDMIQQEFYCSFSAANPGAYYGAEIQAAYAEGRVGRVPYAKGTPVESWWDLGMDDSTSIWLTQTIVREVRVLAYYENTGKGLAHYADWLHEWASQRGLRYERHGLPHDAEVRELGTGKSRKSVLEDELRISPVEVATRLPINDGIDAVRRLLDQCWFDEQGCEQGLSCLTEYTKEFDERNGVFQQKPKHNWACLAGETELLTRYGMCQIMALPESGEVMTQCGWKPYINPHVTRRDAPLVAVRFDDGHTVNCTGDHLFLTDSGWRYAERLQPGTPIQSYWTPSCSTSTAGSGESSRTSDTSVRAASTSTGSRGHLFSDLYRRAATFITGTGIERTTLSPIWSACLPASTSRWSGSSVSQPTPSISRRTPAQQQRRGTPPTRGASGTDDTRSARSRGSSGSASLVRAWRAARRSIASFVQTVSGRSSARPTARPLTIVSVEPLNERADVWCLTVPDVGHFSLANGAIVHNSHGADAFRTLAVLHQGHGGVDTAKGRDRYITRRKPPSWMTA